MDTDDDSHKSALVVLAKEPRFRNEMDVDIIRNYLRRVSFFQSFQASDLETVAYGVVYRRHRPGEVVFRQGESGSDWFVLLSGSVSILVETPEEPEGEVICVVLAGQGFGKESKEGELSRRSATVKAKEDCELLLVDSVVMSARKPTVKRFGSKILIDGMEDGSEAISEAEAAAFTPVDDPISAHLIAKSREGSRADMSRDPAHSGAKKDDAAGAAAAAAAALLASQAVGAQGEAAGQEKAGAEGCGEGKKKKKGVKFDGTASAPAAPATGNGDLSGAGGDAPPPLSEDDLPSELMGINPEEIEAMELQFKQVLSEDLKHLKAFSHISTSMREELANVINFQFFEKAGEYVFRQGDIGTCWYVIYKGSVDVVVNGVAVATLGEGDGFGELALIAEKPRAASIVTKEPGCQLIVVDKKDYLKIQEQISSNTVRLEEHGKVVLTLEKRDRKKADVEAAAAAAATVPASGSDSPLAASPSSGSVNSVGGGSSGAAVASASASASASADAARKDTYMAVLAGTVDRLVLRLMEDTDDAFLNDFLMCFRQFLSIEDFWAKLMALYQQEPEPKKRLVINVIDRWVRLHSTDFRQDSDVLDHLLKFYLRLKAENREFYDKIQSAIIYQRLDPSVKGKSSSFSSTISRTWGAGGEKKPRRASAVTELWRKSIGRIGRRKSIDAKDQGDDDPRAVFKALIPATQWIKVYRHGEDYKTLSVTPHNSAREVIALALDKFRMTESADLFVLCEVRLNETTRDYRDDEISIVSQMSKNGRLYLKEKTATATFPAPPVPDRPDKIHNMVLEITSDEIARVMTLLDYELFSRIDPLEFYYSIFKVKNKNISNLNTFVNRFNEINMWVVTEICSKDVLQKRTATIKKLVEVASLLVMLKNYNSAFAILSGLGNVAVTRMAQSWKKLGASTVQEFERLQQMMDPSRNMRKYRTLVLASQPPLIPFFPILMKDLFFISDCNPTHTPEGLVNFEKFRMINEVVRAVDAYRKVPYDHILQPYSVSAGGRMDKKRMSIVHESFLENQHSSQEISEYLSQLYVIDDVKILTKMSHDVEPKEQK